MTSEIAKLREEVERLRTENAFLRSAISDPIPFPQSWGLLPRQKLLIAAMYRSKGICTRDRLEAAVYIHGVPDLPNDNLISVHISRARSELRRTFEGDTIIPVRGEGYRLSPEFRTAIEEHVVAVRACEVAS